MFHTKQEEKPGIAIFLDFRKAFDTFEWDYLKAALQRFNFGPDILTLFDVIYNNSSSCVLHNGHASDFFLWKEVSDKVAHCRVYSLSLELSFSLM